MPKNFIVRQNAEKLLSIDESDADALGAARHKRFRT
jgi:hypothetical protein